MSGSFSHNLVQALENLKQVHNEQKEKLEQSQHELDYKNSRLEILEKEIATLKKERLNYTSSKQNQLKDIQFNESTPREVLRSLASIHLHDTKYCSDKWEHYFQQYELEFGYLRANVDIRLLEIGIQNGGSLECWSKYFGTGSEIVGIDIDTKTSFLDYEESIKNYVGDATDAAWLKLFCDKEADFDVIIDDASHLNQDIINTFTLIFKKIKPGGIYVVEDVHACYWKHENGSFDRDSAYESPSSSAIAFFKEILEYINIEHWIHLSDYDISSSLPMLSQYIEADEKLANLLNSIESIKFTNSMIFIKRSLEESTGLGRRIVADREAFVQTSIRRYIDK